MDRVLPSNVDYTKILPLAVESRSRRRSFFPVNGQRFTSDGNNIIRIDISASAFLDPKHSYLRFRFRNQSGSTCGFDFGGGHNFIKRLRIEQAGNVLSDCNNYNRLMELVRNGRYKYPGANMVRVKRGDKYIDIDLRYNKSTVNLNMGDEVWRHLQPGDPVLFNRQPTLHKMSMMTHRVKVINNDKLSTFRLNVTVTSPYGADFDGDKQSSCPQQVAAF